MGDTAGTPKKVTLDGTTFDVMGDANFSDSSHQYENEAIPTSGRAIYKKTKKAVMTESVDIATNFEEYQIIVGLNDAIDDFDMSWEDVEGNVYRGKGFINIESPKETETNKTGLTLSITDADGWAAFGA